MDHPSLEDLVSFLEHPSAPGRTERHRHVVKHLLAHCTVCRARLQAVLPPPPGGTGKLADEYDRAFARSEEVLSSFLTTGRPDEQAPMALLAELAPLLWEGSGSSEPGRPAFPQLVRWLTERSHAVRYEDPERMLFWAHLGRLAAEACSVKDARSEQRLADLRAGAWGQFGNAARVRGRLAEAEEAFTIAERHRSKGTGDLSLRAKLSEQLAALQIFERHFDDAFEATDEAASIHRFLGDRHAVARTVVQRGIALLYKGEPEKAVRYFERAVPLVDTEEDPYLLLAARHNLILCHLDLGRITDALVLNRQIQGAYAEHPDSLLMLRATWQEGHLFRELGHLDLAEAALRRVRDGFAERGLAYEAAVVSLDLAAVYTKQGRAPVTGRVLAEAIPIFRALRIGRETLASMAELRRTLTH